MSLLRILDHRLEAVGIEMNEEVKDYIVNFSDRPGMVLVMAYDFLKWTKAESIPRDMSGFRTYVSWEILEKDTKTLSREVLDKHFEVKWDAQKTKDWKNSIDYQGTWDAVK